MCRGEARGRSTWLAGVVEKQRTEGKRRREGTERAARMVLDLGGIVENWLVLSGFEWM